MTTDPALLTPTTTGHLDLHLTTTGHLDLHLELTGHLDLHLELTRPDNRGVRNQIRQNTFDFLSISVQILRFQTVLPPGVIPGIAPAKNPGVCPVMRISRVTWGSKQISPCKFRAQSFIVDSTWFVQGTNLARETLSVLGINWN